jgi:hypothetical protein
MKIVNSNKSHYMIIAGILVISILSIFVAFALGVENTNNFSNNSDRSVRSTNLESLYMLECNKSESILDKIIKSKPDRDDVPVDQTVYNPEKQYVEMGAIEFETDSFNENPDDLPICMSLAYGAKQWVVIKVKGGYEPATKSYYGYDGYYGLMYLKDKNGNIVYNECHPGMFVGWLMDSYQIIDGCQEGTSECDACWVYYNFTLNPEACMNWICLDSSYELDGDKCLCKYYKIEYDTHWKGCEFDKILAHENRVPGIPNSRIKI